MIPTSLQEQLNGARVLLTGSTGFLGKVWLEMALRHFPDIGHIYLLARPGKADSSVQRFEEIFSTSPVFRQLRASHGAEFGAWLTHRVTIVEGDVSLPGLGIEPKLYAQICGEVDAVLNFAGITDFQPDPKAAEQINIQGSLYAADLAAKIESKRLLHVSTCYVAGNQSGPIPESIDPFLTPNKRPIQPAEEHAHLRELIAANSHRTSHRITAVAERAKSLGWPNIYTYSKALAERVLALRQDIELTVVRPSIVECALDAPFPGWNEGINTSAPLSWLIASYFRDLPAQPNHRFDIIPVDTVARAIFQVLAGMLSGHGKPVYQLASSDSNPLSFERTIELNGLAVRRYIRRNGGSVTDRLLLQHLDPVGVPLEHQAWWKVSNLKSWAESAKAHLAQADARGWLPPALREAFGEAMEDGAEVLRDKLALAHRQLRRVEKMLELYRPFIHDNDYEFTTNNIRELDRRLSAENRHFFGWNITNIDWRTYWIDIQYPGLKRWSIPLIHGEQVPTDPAPPYPVHLAPADPPPIPGKPAATPPQETHA